MPTPPNTPALYYLDKSNTPNECKKDKKEVETKCAPDNDNPFRSKGKPLNTTAKGADKAGSWVLDHCGPLMVQPGTFFSEWRKQFADMGAQMNQLAQELKNNVIAKVEQEVMQYGARKLTSMAVRRGLTGWIPVVGWIMTAVDVAMTVADVSKKVTELKALAEELKQTVDRLKQHAPALQKAFTKYESDLRKLSGLPGPKRAKARAALQRDLMADVQSAYATVNPCLRARKCTLVPFSKGADDKWLGKGCCPGQTGHHLLPDAMFRDPAKSAAAKAAWKADPANTVGGKLKTMPRDKLPTVKCWDNYTEGAAPTICVEGNNQHMGSHGWMHKRTTAGLQRLGVMNKPSMPYGRARDLILNEISTLYGCNADCLRKQLDDYYCGTAASKKPGCPKCDKATVVPNSGTGGAPAATTSSTGGAQGAGSVDS